MADAKHTPGPWEYSGGGIWGTSPWNARVRLADITFHNSINGIASEANGRLMCDAPDMLEVLKTSERNIVSLRDAGLPGPLEVWLEVVRAAIAKATGAP